MSTIISVKELRKNFGSVIAVNGVSFTVNKGEMFGLVGPDGAGKTTTMRVLCGLLVPAAGDVSLFGLPLNKEVRNIQKKIGYLSQKFSLYGDLSIDENLHFFARVHGIKSYKEYADRLLSFTRLTGFRTRRVDKLSGGMKQKAALACSLVHKPEILFLDEPTTGVDPVSRRDFWKILSDLLKDGLTIFMTTPYLDEAERCNRVALMHEGRLIALDEPDLLRRSINREILEIVCNDAFGTAKLIRNNFDVDLQLFGDRLNILTGDGESLASELLEYLKQNSVDVISWRKTIPSLENAFIYLINQEPKVARLSEEGA